MSYLNYFIEFIGTFLILSVLLIATTKNSCLNSVLPLSIVILLALIVGLKGFLSGCHFNPAVSTMMVFNKTLNLRDLIPCITAQILGGIAAWKLVDLSTIK